MLRMIIVHRDFGAVTLWFDSDAEAQLHFDEAANGVDILYVVLQKQQMLGWQIINTYYAEDQA